jgi:hypothetical protein
VSGGGRLAAAIAAQTTFLISRVLVALRSIWTAMRISNVWFSSANRVAWNIKPWSICYASDVFSVSGIAFLVVLIAIRADLIFHEWCVRGQWLEMWRMHTCFSGWRKNRCLGKFIRSTSSYFHSSNFVLLIKELVCFKKITHDEVIMLWK